MPEQDNIKTVISTQVDTSQATTGVTNLRKEFSAAFLEVQQTTKGTQEYFAALQKAADAKSQITELRKEISLLNPREQFQAVATTLRGLSGGLESAAGAAILFGSKNKELEETLKQANGAILLFHGLQEFITGMRRAGDIIGILNLKLQQNALVNKEATVATEVSTVALGEEAVAAEGAAVATGGFNTVLAASGIGAILLLLPLLVSGMHSVTEETKEAADARKLNNELNQEAVKNISDELSHTLLLVATIKDANTTKKDQKKAIDDLIEQSPNYFKNLKDSDDITKDLEIDTRKYIAALIDEAKIKAVQDRIQKDEQQLLSDQLGLEAALANARHLAQIGALTDLNIYTAQLKANLADRDKALNAEIESLTKIGVATAQDLSVQGGSTGKDDKPPKAPKEKVDKSNDEIAKAFQEFYAKQKAEQLKSQQDTLAALDDYNNKYNEKQLDARAKELSDDEAAYQDDKFQAMLNGDDLDKLEETHRKNQAAINKKYDDSDEADRADAFKKNSEEYVKGIKEYDTQVLDDKTKTNSQKKALLAAELEDVEAANANMQLSDEDYLKAKQQIADANDKINKAEVKSKEDAVQAISNLLGSLSQAVGAQTMLGKELAIAQTLISIISGGIQLFTKTAAELGGPWGIVVAAASEAALLVTAYSQLSQLNAVDIPGQSGGSTVSAPSLGGGATYTPAQIPTSSTVTALDQNSINAINTRNQNTPVRAYVVERDITNSQSQMASYRSANTIGRPH